MAWPAFFLLSIQLLLLLFFSYFAFFNYLYGIASLWRPKYRRVKPSNKPVAVVIVSFNEKYVLEDTIRSCEALNYSNKVIILADDSTDQNIVNDLRCLAIEKGCVKKYNHSYCEIVDSSVVPPKTEEIEIWESNNFVFFHRPLNVGFKAGSLLKIQEYLRQRGVELMYLLDADWHPQQDALERTMEVLEADDSIAFVQTRRESFPKGMNQFQQYVTLFEEGCYHVDFEGRQVLGHPILFSGCCTLFRMSAVAEVGGFTPGHLTEDLDLTDRFWLRGWKGIYLGEVINQGEVPFSYDHFRRQQERWAAGSARSLKDYFTSIFSSDILSLSEKFAVIRQNAYFLTTLLTIMAICIGVFTIFWITLFWNTYSVELYLYLLGLIKLPLVLIIYGCILSNFFEPLIMILIKKRSYRELVRLPMMVWYAWSILPTYAIGNIKGLFSQKLDWFRTPKFQRNSIKSFRGLPISVRLLNISIFTALLCFYFCQGFFFGWFDEFVLILLPAFFLASIK
jgi:cellulose synthase/poly-beta-1,6-N-acetylglucosamine synthase-like glycosyltransferase